MAEIAEADPRIKLLSYSSLLTLHNCPRKYQLYKLGGRVESVEDIPGSLTFAYGHAVGTGIQHLMEGMDIDQVIWSEFLSWPVDLLHDNPKQNKSFWGAVHALKQFAAMRANGYLADYELVSYQGKPACELSFVIHLPDGFRYRGFVDAVLRHRITGEVVVLECKTTNSANVNPAQYKNSAQAIGYSIVLDAIFPDLSSYKVIYLVYQTKAEEYVQIPFDKSYYLRALWIRELMLDIETIKMYEEAEIYPMRGESCYSFFRECEYLQVCTLSTDNLTTPQTVEEAARMELEISGFQIHVTLQDLILSQVDKDQIAPRPVAPPELELIDELFSEDEIL